jgi:hypothetical protein
VSTEHRHLSATSTRKAIARLHAIRTAFGDEPASEKLHLLQTISAGRTVAATDVMRLHRCLVFMRAFPDSPELHATVILMLDGFPLRVTNLTAIQRARLADSGIAGTQLHYPFSFEVATWINTNFPGVASIDWDELPDTGRVDELLEHLLEHAESDYFHGGQVGTEDWLDIVTGNYAGTDFDWLMQQLIERQQYDKFWTALYNVADLPLKCKLQNNLFSRTACALQVDGIHFRTDGMRRRVPFARREIVRPVATIRLAARAGSRLLDVARSSLALRHRETDHFNNANPDEVYVADVGQGIRIALIGLLPEHRDPLECTLGYLILSNGVPVGYGGASVLFRQANTGINIFDEFRGSNAAWFWTQVMRVVHSLTACNRFIVNPYQFGEDNSEALKSGAFWFYYRLGYRPVDADVRKLARKEFLKLRKRTTYRSPIPILKKLATCDLHLTLPDARRSEFFDESWIEASAQLASRSLARAAQPSRRKAMSNTVHQVMSALDVRTTVDWPAPEHEAFVRLCPIVTALDLANWPMCDRDALVQLMRAKGGKYELDYVRRLRDHARFFQELKKQCRILA